MRTQLETIRPDIKSIKNDLQSSEAERFQNVTIRPILKFQNSLILSLVNNHLFKHKIILSEMSQEKRFDTIKSILLNDRKFHELMTGIVVGLFTDQELTSYFSNEKELKKRITKMMIKRIQSQLCE
jgi:pyoverdine/dityrosine biosynthesis protein Dit1